MESTDYFAYGSNMSVGSMRSVCAAARFIGPASLSGYRMTFSRRSIVSGTGVADIVAEPGAEVWGALYAVGPGELEQLDRKEGRGFAYERVEVLVRGLDHATRPAIAYSVIAKEPGEICPSAEYMRLLIAGASERGLPAGYIASLRGIAVRWGIE
jgi:gamma-glutamylcyclotransferase